MSTLGVELLGAETFGAVAPALGMLLATATMSGLAILVLRPLLVRYALARPNARSAHATPVPQGGGIAVIGSALLATLAGAGVLGIDAASWVRLGLVASGAVVVAVIGLVDDLRPLPPWPRLGLQLLAMALAVAALPEGTQVLPFLPVPLERVVLVVGGAWFINLTNFMDGMDWMTVAEMVPITAALALFWHWGMLSRPAGLIALSLCGGLIGFAPFNKPVARLFLGDVGSLAIGLLVAFCLFDLASHGGLAAALLLALYYIADSGVTLIRRIRRGERVWEAHRQHFYQVAVARGFTVRDVLARVFVANIGLGLFAAASLLEGSAAMILVDLGLGGWIVYRLLRGLARGRAVASPP